MESVESLPMERLQVKTYCIVLASGTGTRFGGDIPKQFVEIEGRMLVEYTLSACASASVVDEILVVVSESWAEKMRSVADSLQLQKTMRIVIGGATRKESCWNGVAAIADDEAKVVIHNGVQPFVKAKDIELCVQALNRYDAVSVGSPSVYTILELNENRELKRIVDRRRSVNDLGPECFKLRFLRKVFEVAGEDINFTNITGMVVKYGLGDVYVVDGDPSNIKITYPDDFILAKHMFMKNELKR